MDDINNYRNWLIEMSHKYGRDELIALVVQMGEEELLKSVLVNWRKE